MLIKCPKCGFSQPKDQYCARCGVDIEAYKPQTESAFTKIFLSPIFQIGLILAIIASATTFVMNRSHLLSPDAPRSNIRAKAYTNSDIEQTATTNSSGSEAPSPSPIPANAEEASGATTPAPPSPSSTDKDSNTMTAASRSEPSSNTLGASNSAASTSPAAHAIGIRVSYTIIDNGFLNRIYEDSLATGQFATFASYNAGLVPDIEKKLNPSNTRIRVLHKVEERVEEGKSKSWFLGNRTPEGDELGLTTSIEYKDIDRNGVFRGTFIINRNWREKTTYPAEVEMTPQNGFFISGVMPRTLPEGVNGSITSISPFDILKDASFRTKAAEFVIFLELTK